jgi:sugar phosphate isomerase/epimerase
MFKNLNLESLGISGCDSEVIGLVLSNGFKGLDLDLVDFAAQVKTQGFARASRLIASARLKIGSFALPVRWQDDLEQHKADIETLAALAEVAKQIGCTRATTFIEAASERRPYHENFEYHRHRLAEIADVLRPFQIRLGIGFLAPKACREDRPFQFMQTFDEIVLLLRSVGSPNVGLSVDTWHWHLGGGKLESLRAVGTEQIVTVSLADAEPNTTAADAKLDERRWPNGSGEIDNAGVLATLAEMRYDGPVTPAPGKKVLAGLGRDKLVKQAGAGLDEAWKAAGLNPSGRLTAVPGR